MPFERPLPQRREFIDQFRAPGSGHAAGDADMVQGPVVVEQP